MTEEEMRAQIAEGNGFIAALDQSGGSTPKALAGYGVGEEAWSNEDEMFGLIHQMRSRVITAPSFGNGKVIGAILFEKTMDGDVDGRPTPDKLKERGVVPFIKVDQGLADEENGVQMMKPLTKLDALLDKSVAKGMFGTKMRSVINLANEQGIADVVQQQFDVGKQILAKGLVPIIEPETSINSPERAEAETIMVREILKQLDTVEDGHQVMLKLTLPKERGLYKPLIDHPKVLKVVALSGGFTRDEACTELAANPGMIASFSRALLEELRADMDDGQFDEALDRAIDEIHCASVA